MSLPRRQLLLVCSLAILGCTTPSPVSAPKRPAGVPADALWSGGADGGVFLRIAKKAGSPRLVYDVVVYNDFTGEVWFKGPMTLSAPGELEARSLREPKTFGGWDGTLLYLADGRHLAPTTGGAKGP